MAAAASVAELPPGFKFAPEDDELIAHYLLPRLRGQRLPFDGAIVEADPLSAPPWELLEKYGRKNDAFFFAAGQAKGRNESQEKRICAGGGSWKGQNRTKASVDGEKLLVPGTGEEISWRKYLLNFHADGEQGSTGWVMDEYAVIAPTDLASSSSVMAYHIRLTGHGKNSKRKPQDSGGVDAEDRGAGAAPPLPPLEDYPLAAEATPPESDQGSYSGVMDSAAFPEHTHEPLFFADDLINLQAAGTSP